MRPAHRTSMTCAARCSATTRTAPSRRTTPSEPTIPVWAYGFRNPFGIAFSPTGQLAITMNGPSGDAGSPPTGYDTLYLNVTRGAHYQWPDCYGYSHPLATSTCGGGLAPNWSSETSTYVPTGATFVDASGPAGYAGHLVFCTYDKGMAIVTDRQPARHASGWDHRAVGSTWSRARTTPSTTRTRRTSTNWRSRAERHSSARAPTLRRRRPLGRRPREYQSTAPAQRHQVERFALLTSVWTNPRRFAMHQDNFTDTTPRPTTSRIGAASVGSAVVLPRSCLPPDF